MTHGTNKYSIWILPTGEAADNLKYLIKRISELYQTPVYPPHITLVGTIFVNFTEIDGIKQCIEKLTKQLTSFSVTLTEFGSMDEEFRCLYARAISQQLPMLYEQFSYLFPQVKNEHFSTMTHLSLMYGHVNSQVKQQIIRENPILPIDCAVRSLALYNTNDSVASWSLEQEFPLG